LKLHFGIDSILISVRVDAAIRVRLAIIGFAACLMPVVILKAARFRRQIRLLGVIDLAGGVSVVYIRWPGASLSIWY